MKGQTIWEAVPNYGSLLQTQTKLCCALLVSCIKHTRVMRKQPPITTICSYSSEISRFNMYTHNIFSSFMSTLNAAINDNKKN